MKVKKAVALGLCAAMAASMAACGSSSSGSSGSTAAAGSGTTTAFGATATSSTIPSFDKLNIDDYTDLSADIKILTDRMDIADTTYADYAKQFQEKFPNINVTYEGVTDYAESVTLRLTNGDWGDICFIPDSVEKTELSTYSSRSAATTIWILLITI